MKRLGLIFFLLLAYYQNSFSTTVRLVTIGPGDAFWSAFGHTAIAIDDVVYGFGYFSFDDDIVSSFIGNRMQYDLGVSDLSYEIQLARQQNRDFSTIELDLSAEEIKQIADHLKWHMLPENQSYGYDYFLNNCSTKVRDLLNMALDPNLHHQTNSSEQEKNGSYKDHTFPARHQGLMNFGLALGYGWPAYTVRDSWELMAFPVYLEQNLITNLSGISQPRQLIFQAQEGNQILSLLLTHWLLIVYVLLWSILLLFKATQSMASKTWFVWHGIIGMILLGLWLLTPHSVANWNFNVLLMMPLGLLITRFKGLIPVIVLSWFCWLIVALYLQAWYLMPLLLPGFLAIKAYVESNKVSIKQA